MVLHIRVYSGLTSITHRTISLSEKYPTHGVQQRGYFSPDMNETIFLRQLVCTLTVIFHSMHFPFQIVQWNSAAAMSFGKSHSKMFLTSVFSLVWAVFLLAFAGLSVTSLFWVLCHTAWQEKESRQVTNHRKVSGRTYCPRIKQTNKQNNNDKKRNKTNNKPWIFEI